jgi:hypothetical protein
VGDGLACVGTGFIEAIDVSYVIDHDTLGRDCHGHVTHWFAMKMVRSRW